MHPDNIIMKINVELFLNVDFTSISVRTPNPSIFSSSLALFTASSKVPAAKQEIKENYNIQS